MSRTDEQLLDAIAGLYAVLDPAPDDLSAAVLARLEIETLDLDYELLTLIEQVDHASGTRGTDLATAGDTTIALEFAGSSCHLLVRVSTVDGHRRLDGWIVPPALLRVSLVYDDLEAPQRHVDTDADGRFEFSGLEQGRVRLWLAPLAGSHSSATGTQLVTPPFEL